MSHEDCIIIIIIIVINTATYSFRRKIITTHTHVSLYYTVVYSMTIFLTRLNSNNNNNTRYVFNEDQYNS